MGMETDLLRWFQQVADGATVTEVAEIYQVSQPAVSRALGRLEDEIGTPLLQRSGRLLKPTHAGIIFKRHVDTLLHELDDGIAAITQLIDPETGTVSVAFQLSLGTWLVPQLVSRFHRRHPDVEFDFSQSKDALGSSLVADGRVDLELTARRPRNPAVEWRPITTERLLLAVPHTHRLAHRREIALAELADEPFVMLRPPWELRQASDALCRAAGFAPNVAFEGDDLPMVTGFVTAGLGIAIVPAMGADPRVRWPGQPALVPISDPGAAREIGIARSTERRLLPSAELFWEFATTKTQVVRTPPGNPR